MSIRSIPSPYGPQRVTTPGAPAPANKDGAAPPVPTPTATPRHDSVSISDAGRTLSGGPAAAKSGRSLSPERVSELRQKVLGGAYNSTHVVDAVAKRLLSSGDV